MLLGIPGDNTYSNLAEAQRIFWRQTVLPLVNRTATALTNWLASTYAPDAQWASEGASKSASDLRLVPDLDAIEALSPERETLWARLEKTSFLTPDEKRAAIGYGPLPPSTKFNPYHDELGRFTTADGEGQGGDGDLRDLLHPAAGGRGKKPNGARKRKAGQSGKEAAKDVPSWAKGEHPRIGEDGKTFAKRLLDKKYGVDPISPCGAREFPVAIP